MVLHLHPVSEDLIYLPELAAETLPQYVDLSVQLVGDLSRLMRLRQSLRPRIATAMLTDETRFVQEVEAAYRAMWREWCATYPSIC